MDDELTTQPKERDDALLKTVIKAVAVMDCFSTLDRKLSIAEIAKRLKMPRGTAHRLVTTLREVGFVEQERERDEYRLGLKLFELGNIVLANMDLHREAKSFVEALTDVTGEAVHLCVFDGIQTTLIHRTEPTNERTNTVVVMEASPAHCTATGKAALAFQTDEVVERVIRLGLRPYTHNTITDPAALRKELALIRERGYSIDDEELSPGTRCVGAPIRNLSGRVFASISVSGPTRRVTKEKVPSLGETVMHYAAGISARLGYRPAQEEAVNQQ
ncbi:IclR family transcriptional regulator [Burkholderia multivorans]|uniref:IclR family transcriptional regulator n=1 Tax=Burkholderia multivorans TaxID=87883 RepID=UPI002ED29A28|nr:IclR family transcriptional regulator [Burkholderia multivorans]